MTIRDTIRGLAEELIDQMLRIVHEEFVGCAERANADLRPLLQTLAGGAAEAPRRARKPAAKRPGRPTKKAVKKAPAKTRRTAKKRAGKKSRKG